MGSRKLSFAELTAALARLKEAEVRSWVVSKGGGQYILASFKGAGEISPKWNVTFYTNTRGNFSAVCNDWETYDRVVSLDLKTMQPPTRPAISFDDAGGGFPLCGVMVGVSDEKDVFTDVVPVQAFQIGSSKEEYLEDFAKRGVKLLDRFDVSTTTHRIEICTGYINTVLKQALRDLGFEVKVVEIRGLLQTRLESEYRKYVARELAEDLYFDPKVVPKREIGQRYYRALDFGLEYRPDMLKTMWKSIQNNRIGHKATRKHSASSYHGPIRQYDDE